MKVAIDAIYERGIFRPLRREAVALTEGRQVRITVDDEREPEALQLAMNVYDGLSAKELDEIEQMALDRGNFFGMRSPA